MKNETTRPTLFRLALLLCAFWGGFFSLSAQDIFFEDFQNGIPEDFKLVDVDGLTPNNDNFTEAWFALEDDQLADNIVAASTSWYQPPGQSDDWMMTPMITIPEDDQLYELAWRGRAFEAAFPDGYEVRLTTDTARSVDSFATVLFSVDAENPNWTRRSVDLEAYKGMTVAFAFRNNSNDQNLLYIDDISVGPPPQFDVGITRVGDVYPQFSLVPVSQALPFSFEVEVTNFGLQTADSVAMEAVVFDASGINVLYSDGMGGPLDSLPAQQSHVFQGTGSFVPPDTGVYFAAYFLSIAQQDEDTLNDFDFTGDRVVDSTFARDVPPLTGFFSIGTGQGGIMGQTFPIQNIDTLTSITAAFVDPPIDQETRAVIFAMGAEEPTTLLYESTPYTFTEEDNPNPDDFDVALVTFGFPDALLVPGVYFFGVTEGAEGLGIGSTTDIYTQGISYLFVEGDAQNPGFWVKSEDAYNNFDQTFVVRPHFGSGCSLDAEFTVTQDDGSGNGTALANPIGGIEPYEYAWSTGQTTALAVNLSAGAYTLTLSDAVGCSRTFDIVIGTVSIEDDRAAGLSTFEVFPNPNQGSFSIEIELAERDDLQVELFDLQGRQVYKQWVPTTLNYQEQITLGDKATNVYLLRVSSSKGSTYRRIIVR